MSWETVKPFAYLTKDDHVITVPEGFETDAASVPRWAWSIFPPTGKYLEAAIIHDWLYSSQKIGGEWITRKEADQIFYEAMTELDIKLWRRWLIYRAVRLGGHKHFDYRAIENGNEKHIG